MRWRLPRSTGRSRSARGKVHDGVNMRVVGQLRQAGDQPERGSSVAAF